MTEQVIFNGEPIDYVTMDPTGNLTATVLTPVNLEDRETVAQMIIKRGIAEHVGFVTEPVNGGDCRVEMLGGEFRGNAIRALAFMMSDETGVVRVETTPIEEPVKVYVNHERKEAYTDMPFPMELGTVTIGNQDYPLVHMQGLNAIIVMGHPTQIERKLFFECTKPFMNGKGYEAWGIMFVSDEVEYEDDLEMRWLVPVVYVTAEDRYFWESSTGSGSVAAAFYMAQGKNKRILFQEPGGELYVDIKFDSQGNVSSLLMGGSVNYYVNNKES